MRMESFAPLTLSEVAVKLTIAPLGGPLAGVCAMARAAVIAIPKSASALDAG